MKKAITILLALVAALALALGAAGCSDEAGASETSKAKQTTTTSTSDATEVTSEVESETVATYSDALTLAYDENDLDATWNESTASFITLADGSIRFDGSSAGAEAGDKKVTIKEAGTYVVSGEMSDGQIVVDVEETGLVKLVLNGVDITCAESAPIYIKSAEKVVLVLVDGTDNSVTDGDVYVLDDAESDEPNAAIFSKANLTINGTGSLVVTANYNDGITSNDDLKIVSGDITVDAVNDAIKGKDCLGVKEATISVNADGDGLQATNDTDADKGFICISGGIVDITAGADGIQAETTLLVTAGDLTLSTGGGSANSSSQMGQGGNTWGDWGQGQTPGGRRDGATTDTTEATTDTTEAITDAADAADTADANADTGDGDSAKALKAGGGVFIDGGAITIDSSDDSIHSNDIVEINGGTLTLTSGDDGVHADTSLTINGGQIDITESYEGIESATITINDGTIHIVASDDGVNIAGGADSSSISGRAGQNDFTASESNYLYINGGYIAVDATGDGIDSNGWIEMTAGTLLVNGPTNSGNGAIDYLGEWTVTGGFVVAAGSSGMAQAPSDSSTQYAIMVGFSENQAAGTLVHIEDEAGNNILTFAPTKQFQSLVVSSPDLQEGATYTVFLGGSSTGAVADSVYSDGEYSGGAEYVTLTLSSIITTSGAAGEMFPGGSMQGGGTKPDGTDSGTVPGGGQGGRPSGGTPPSGAGGTMPGGGTAPSDGSGAAAPDAAVPGDTTATTISSS